MASAFGATAFGVWVSDRGSSRRCRFYTPFFIAVLRMLCTLAVWSLAQSPLMAAQPNSTDVIWFETPVAEISVGYDPVTAQSLQRTFYLAYVGPQDALVSPQHDPTAAMRAARACSETVRPIRTQLQHALALANYNARKLGPSEKTAQLIADTNTALLILSGSRPAEFFACVRTRGFSQLADSHFHLTLVQRNCTQRTCPLSESKLRLSDDEQTGYFADLFEWAASKLSVMDRSKTGLFLSLDALTKPDASVSLNWEVAQNRETNKWLPDEDTTTAAKHLAALVDRIREGRRADGDAPRLSPFALVSVGLGRNDLLTIADALTEPVAAYALARTDVTDQLTNVSNELARSQLFECRYLQGAFALDTVRACSGYTLDAGQLQACLSGGICRSVMANQVDLAGVMENAPLTLGQIARANPFPRGTEQIASLKDRFDRCSAGGASSDQAAACFMRASFAADSSLTPMQICLGHGDVTTQTRCALHVVSPAAAGAEQCVETGSAASGAKCLAAQYLPPEYRAIYACLAQASQSGVTAVCGSVAGGDAGRLAGCLQQSRGQQNPELLVAACVAGNRLPQPVREAVGCIINNGGGSLTQIGVCVAATQVSPQLARQIGCVVESHGSPMAAGVCVATTSLNLTPEQQLALQCLASTGGQPYAFAACFGGQLTMREMVKCKGKAFGQDDCFGPNNEFQKAARALTGHDISSNSVVGQVLTVGITPATYVVQIAQPFVDNGMQTLSASINNVKDGISKLSQGDFGGFAHDAVNEILNPVTSVGNFFKRIF